MQGLAEVEGNPMKIREASQKIERDIGPLSKEVARALQILQRGNGNGNSNGSGNDNNSSSEQAGNNREELFYQAPAGINGRDYGYNSGDMESLIGSSEDMLRESLS